jgi:hypothetical protein
MAESGADFVITGEVLGQRPMSQRRDTLRIIERESGLEGLLLRPLSARHFSPTIPEQEGWVDRERLLAISGRSRKEQIRIAEELDVTNYPCPAGGCLLTETAFVPKIRDIFDHSDTLKLRDFRLLRIGRHFRIGQRTKFIMGRDEADNALLEHNVQQDEVTLRWLDGGSPLGVITGDADQTMVDVAARLLLRYTRAGIGDECRMKVVGSDGEKLIMVRNDSTESLIESLRI